MSSYEGGGFDEWVRDSFFCTLSQRQLDQIKAILEPYREMIDNKLDHDFEPETMSWRAYRNSLWSCIPDGVNQRIDEIVRPMDLLDDSFSIA